MARLELPVRPSWVVVIVGQWGLLMSMTVSCAASAAVTNKLSPVAEITQYAVHVLE